jgi:lipopolysaccharide export system permease protein
MGDLISPPEDDPVFKRVPGEFRSELHDRIFAPIYPFVFVLMAFAILGAPRTTRQNRNFAIALLVVGILVVRIAGFGLSTTSNSQPVAVLVQYLMLAAVGAGSFWLILRGVIIDAPANLLAPINALFNRAAALRPR